jgi:hypothetical protein
MAWNKVKLFVFVVLVCASPKALAIRGSSGGGGGGLGGGNQIGFEAGVIQSEQEHMNTLISRANTRAGGISTPAMNQAYEFTAHYGYRFNGSIIAVLFRPSYFYQQSKGSGGGSSYNYGVNGFTFFPMLRLYPLENDMMKFFMNFGIGYGRSSGTIEEGANKIDFAGDAFGTLLGLGAEFCYDAHCLAVEGNYRYLKMERNIAGDVTGDFSTAGNSLSRASKNKEVEMDGTDLAVRMSGLQMLVGYVYHF